MKEGKKKNRTQDMHTCRSEMYVTLRLLHHTQTARVCVCVVRQCQPLLQAQHSVQKALPAGGGWGTVGEECVGGAAGEGEMRETAMTLGSECHHGAKDPR